MVINKKRKKIVFRAHDWIDLKTLKPVKSVQARFVGKRFWMHVTDGKELRTFKTERQRTRALVALELQELARRLAAKERLNNA